MTSPAPRLGPDVLDELDGRLAPADAELAARYPGDPGTRQPVHTVYVPADQMTSGLPADWGARALAALADHAPTAAALAAATGLDEALVAQVLPAVLAKLATEQGEDLRIDFEDGYGPRSDEREGAAAAGAARALAGALAAAAPPRTPGCASAPWRRPPAAVGCAPSTCSWAPCWPRPRRPTGSWSPCPR